MARPDNNAIRAFIDEKIQLWNSGKRPELAALYRAFAPNAMTFEYVGGPVLDGYVALEDMWERFGNEIEMEVVDTLINGDEVACYIKNHRRSQPGFFTTTIEVYQIGDGTLHERYFYPVPE
ncbi:MAG: hypothetical protein WDA10_06885 [Porticoccaceae bacterium]|jgi:hypothetical protein|nr:hypothetical protein [Porticoccaceae bacterium]HLS98378.1 hypothetical protein [Porticoccaceae bacterium]